VHRTKGGLLVGVDCREYCGLLVGVDCREYCGFVCVAGWGGAILRAILLLNICADRN
jgi:hypothetical protein